MKKSIIAMFIMMATLGFSQIIDGFAINGQMLTNVYAPRTNYPLKDNYITCLQYDVVITNFTKSPITVGYLPDNSCDRIGCLVFHQKPIESTTDYYEHETVIKKSMLKSEEFGEICLKETVISKRSRTVRQVSKMVTNDWADNNIIYHNLINATNSHYIINNDYTITMANLINVTNLVLGE